MRSRPSGEPDCKISKRHTLRILARMTLLGPSLLYGPIALPARLIAPTEQLKAGYRKRLTEKLGKKALPYIDIESSCAANQLDLNTLVRAMDALDIGIMALSIDVNNALYARGERYDPYAAQLVAKYPEHFIPTGNAGVPPVWTRDPEGFLGAYERDVGDGNCLLMGEFEFRHYPSPRQVRRAQDRDESVPIDGEIAHRIFRLSEASGLPFQIHYEIEDALLPPLEAMLARYPKARVIWCHLAQVRYIERARTYTPAYVEGLIKRFPNLYFDTAFGGPQSVYPVSGQRHARIWTDNGELVREWLDLLVAYPQRFLAALDLGSDRMHRIREWDGNLRNFLAHLPMETRHQIAYRSAWRLLFGEEFA